MIREVCEAVVEAINREVWSLSFVAERGNYTKLDRKSLGEPGTVTVRVAPRTRTSTQITRGSTRPAVPPKHERDYTVLVLFAVPLSGQDDTADTDPLIAMCEELAERIEAQPADPSSPLRNLTIDPLGENPAKGIVTSVVYGEDVAPILAREEIESLNVFVAGVALTVRVVP